LTANVGVNIRELELERLKELLEYDPDTGVFRWKVAHGFGLPGEVAGHITGGVGNKRLTNYIRIRIDTIRYPAHHLAWLYVTGEPPASEVDHWDNDGTNNAWTNLRPASRGQNECNKGIRADNTSGVKGVRLTRGGTWEAKIKHNGKREHLGTFATIEEAAVAYARASARLHGEFGRVATRQPAESGATETTAARSGTSGRATS
jgi:hypothetical protein